LQLAAPGSPRRGRLLDAMELTDILDGLTHQQGPNGPDTWPEALQENPKRAIQVLELAQFLVEVRCSKCRLADSSHRALASVLRPVVARGWPLYTTRIRQVRWVKAAHAQADAA
jgi:hypothetical protein